MALSRCSSITCHAAIVCTICFASHVAIINFVFISSSVLVSFAITSEVSIATHIDIYFLQLLSTVPFVAVLASLDRLPLA